MSWSTLPENVQAVAETILTDKQLAAWKLEIAGLSMRAIGQHLDVARQTAVDRIAAANRALRKAGVRQDASGQWHLTNETEAA